MQMRAIGTYRLTIVGNGSQTEVNIPLERLKTPDPFTEGLLPTGVASVKVGPNPGGGTATIEGEMLHFIFDVAPANGVQTAVSVDALFGTDY
jgi:hypothetical protein